MAIRAAAVFLALVPFVAAHAASPWRVWSKSDGLTESWVFGLTPDSQGRILVKHGDVPTMSVLDGYQIALIPSQHGYGRVLSSPANELWTFDAEGILVYDASGWHKYPDSEI